MILYTMMPYEQVFPQEAENTVNQMTILYNGIPLLAEPADQNEYKIVRVLSTDPKHYLDPACIPGSKISLLHQKG